MKTILIIDDDLHLAATLALGLETHGYRALHAADAAAGWRLAHAHLPDLVLSDIDMPGKDGRRLLQEMRADPVLANRQFVLMTGKREVCSSRTAMDLGADDFLTKPFALTDVLHCVAARLQRAELSRRLDGPTISRIGSRLRSELPREFFTPLASILGLSELLQLELEKLTPAAVREDLRDINLSGHRLLRSIRNYLLLLELEGGSPATTAAPLDAAAVAEALTSGATIAAERHRRTSDLVLDLRPVGFPAKLSDLRTIAEELVDNAFGFSRPATPVHVRCWRDGFVLQLAVSDAGRGMTLLQLQRLNDAWQKPLPDSRTRGLGIGLVLVRYLARSLKGELRLESRDGEGTTSYVTLPIPPV
ncbi:MAG: response regulator [Verrucomicrobia bacterium]|nr:response regulator [Verrucomicrobiota bacterium]